MKKSILTFAIFFFSTLTIFANSDEKFMKAMGSTIPGIFKATNLEEMTPIINKLTRIASAEPEKWEPSYYTGFAYIRLSQMSKVPAEKDKYIDLAIEQINKGISIAPGESEMETLKGYALMMKMVVDPMTRGQEYSPLVFGSFQKAIAMNEKNPRAWMLLGQMQLGTAQFFNSGTEEGCATVNKSINLFNSQESPNPIYPSWGLQSAKEVVKSCK